MYALQVLIALAVLIAVPVRGSGSVPVPSNLGEWQIERVVGPSASDLSSADVFVLGPETFALKRLIVDGRSIVQAVYLDGWSGGKKVEIGSGSYSDRRHPAKGSTAPLVFRCGGANLKHIQDARILLGQGRLYIDEEPYFDRSRYWGSGNGGKVYAWDSNGLRVAMGPGDTVSIGGQQFMVKWAELMDVSPAGEAALYFAADKPRGTYGLAMHGAQGIRGVVAEDQPVPGMPDATLLSFEDDAFATNDGGLVVWAKVRQRGKDIKGIFYFSERRSQALLIEGAPLPGNPDVKVRPRRNDLATVFLASSKSGIYQGLIAARDARTFLFWQQDLYPKRYYWLCHDATCTKLVFDKHEGFGPQDAEVKGIEFLGSDTSAGVLSVRFSDSSRERSDAYLFDGRQLTRLSRPEDYWTSVTPIRGSGPFTGVIISGSQLLRQPEYRMGYRPDRPGVFQSGQRGFIDSKAVEKGLQPIPEFRTVDGRQVRLGNVRVWFSPNDAIVELDDGLYRMRRSGPVALK